jgi:hypothetical protein
MVGSGVPAAWRAGLERWRKSWDYRGWALSGARDGTLMRSIAAACVPLFLALPATAQPQLGTNEVVFKSSEWSVVRTTRSRSHTVNCTAFYRAERDIQLTADQLIVKVPPGLQQVVVRHGDELSLPPRPPTAAEKQLSAVVFSGDALRQALAARKLAVEVTTQQGRKAVLLRMKGASDAVANMRSGCAAPAKPLVLCTEPLRARMRENGVTPGQIDKICR